MHSDGQAPHDSTPAGMPVLGGGAHQGLSLLVMLGMLSVMSSSSLSSSSSRRSLLMRQGTALCPQLCTQLLGRLLSMDTFGRGPGLVRGSLAGGAALIGQIITRLTSLAAVALQHVCHG